MKSLMCMSTTLIFDLPQPAHPKIKDIFIDFVHLIHGRESRRTVDQEWIGRGSHQRTSLWWAYSDMSSDNVGTQTYIKARNPLELYTRCRSRIPIGQWLLRLKSKPSASSLNYQGALLILPSLTEKTEVPRVRLKGLCAQNQAAEVEILF